MLALHSDLTETLAGWPRPRLTRGTLKETDMADAMNLDKTFTYQAPDDEQIVRHNLIRTAGKSFALEVLRRTLPSREQSLALTKIEEAVMWANAAVARNG